MEPNGCSMLLREPARTRGIVWQPEDEKDKFLRHLRKTLKILNRPRASQSDSSTTTAERCASNFFCRIESNLIFFPSRLNVSRSRSNSHSCLRLLCKPICANNFVLIERSFRELTEQVVFFYVKKKKQKPTALNYSPIVSIRAKLLHLQPNT